MNLSVIILRQTFRDFQFFGFHHRQHGQVQVHRPAGRKGQDYFWLGSRGKQFSQFELTED